MSIADIYSRIMGYFGAGDERPQESVFSPQVWKYPHVAKLSTYQNLGFGGVFARAAQQQRGLTDIYLSQLQASLGGELHEFRLGKDTATLDLDERRRYVEFLLNIKTARVGVPVEAALGIDPILAQTALNLYALVAGRRGSHNCRLADDPLIDGLPLLLTQKLLDIAQLLHGRCVFSSQSKQLLSSFLDITSAPHYNNSADCNNQNGPTGGKEWDGFTKETA